MVYFGTPYAAVYFGIIYAVVYFGTPYAVVYFGTPYAAVYFGTPYAVVYFGTPYAAVYFGTPYAVVYVGGKAKDRRKPSAKTLSLTLNAGFRLVFSFFFSYRIEKLNCTHSKINLLFLTTVLQIECVCYTNHVYAEMYLVKTGF